MRKNASIMKALAKCRKKPIMDEKGMRK